jgi:hypothetical protein
MSCTYDKIANKILIRINMKVETIYFLLLLNFCYLSSKLFCQSKPAKSFRGRLL